MKLGKTKSLLVSQDHVSYLFVHLLAFVSACVQVPVQGACTCTCTDVHVPMGYD